MFCFLTEAYLISLAKTQIRYYGTVSGGAVSPRQVACLRKYFSAFIASSIVKVHIIAHYCNGEVNV